MVSHGGATLEGQIAVLRYAIKVVLSIRGPADLREARVSAALLKIVMGVIRN